MQLNVRERIGRSGERKLGAYELTATKAGHVRSQYASGFHVNGDTAEKRHQRSLVVRHLSDADSRSFIRMLSLPAELWIVERDIHFAFSGAQFVACETDVTTFLRAVAMMPREYMGQRAISCVFDSDFVSEAQAFTTNKSLLINCDVLDLLSGEHSPVKKKGDIVHRCALNSFNRFWIDGFSPIGTERSVLTVRRMVARSSKFGSWFALAFTIGRDDQKICRVIDACPGEDALERRARFIELIASKTDREVVIDSVHRHPSWNENGNVMIGTVFGHVKPIAKYQDNWISTDGSADTQIGTDTNF